MRSRRCAGDRNDIAANGFSSWNKQEFAIIVAGSRVPCTKWRLNMARKYSRSASKDVKSAMDKRKRGTLKSGSSGKKVTSRKQAIAIGLSEARRKGKKVPKKRASR
jgi:Family of unknown function (DUF6496)